MGPIERRIARCPVSIHELTDGNLAVSYLGQQLARFNPVGALLGGTIKRRAA
jgi:hypothetical protein